MRPRYYKLIDKLVVPLGMNLESLAFEELNELEAAFGNKIVAQEDVGEAWVSTVFLSIDHNFEAMMEDDDDALPIVFETMIFPTDIWGYQTRCSTWDQAINMHQSAVGYARNKQRQLPMVIK